MGFIFEFIVLSLLGWETRVMKSLRRGSMLALRTNEGVIDEIA